MLRSCLATSKGINATICKINNFSIVTSICLNYHVHNQVVSKIVVEKFSFSELKSEKKNCLFTQSSTKIFCVSIFNVGGYLANLVSAIFYQIFIFDQMIGLQKLWKMFFISSKKLFLFSRYSNFCNFFPSFPHFPDSKG